MANREKNFLLGLVELFLAIIIIFSVIVTSKSKKEEQESKVQLPGRYLITMRWEQRLSVYENDDCDLHVVCGDSHAWYADPTGGDAYINLESPDNTGNPLIYYTDINTGELTMCQFHEERSIIRTTIANSEIIVSVFMYNKRLSGTPTKVMVTLIDLQKSSQEIIKEELELLYTGEQKVAFRIKLDALGNIVPGSVNYIPFLIEQTRRYR